MHRWKPTDSTGFLELLVPNGKFVEVGVADIEKIEKEFNGDYQGILGKYDKVILSQQTEGYGMRNRIKHFYDNFDTEKIFIINDGFVCEKYLSQIYPNIPRENIFINPILSIWCAWNMILSDKGREKIAVQDMRTTNKINDGFRTIHKNNIDNLLNVSNKFDRDYKFIVLNNNYKPGRAQFVDRMSESFIKENWVSANFFKEKPWNLHKWENFYPPITNPAEKEEYRYLREDDYTKYENNQSGWNSCYEILWKEHLNKAYIQPYWESTAWTDALTDGHYMISEKTLMPIIMGHITIPLAPFHVDYLEKLGYKFIKKIGNISINETISQDEFGFIGSGEGAGDRDFHEPIVKLCNKIFDKILKINDECSLEDIKKTYVENYDMIQHNKNLLKKHVTHDSVLKDLKTWIEK